MFIQHNCVGLATLDCSMVWKLIVQIMEEYNVAAADLQHLLSRAVMTKFSNLWLIFYILIEALGEADSRFCAEVRFQPFFAEVKKTH